MDGWVEWMDRWLCVSGQGSLLYAILDRTKVWPASHPTRACLPLDPQNPKSQQTRPTPQPLPSHTHEPETRTCAHHGS
jgi:hypothetical protein